MRRVRGKYKALFGARLFLVDGVHAVVKVRKSGMRQPRFIKVQNVDLAVELLLDDLVVVDDAVVGRLRERHDAGLGLFVLNERIAPDFLFDV